MVFEIKRVERCPWHGCRLIWFETPDGDENCICESLLVKKLKMSKEMVDELIEDGTIEKLYYFLCLALAMAELKKSIR